MGTSACPFLHDIADKVDPECGIKRHRVENDRACVGVISKYCPLNECDEIVVRRLR